MTRVVVVTPEIDARPTSGGAIRTQRLVAALARRAETAVLVVGHETDAGLLRDVTGASRVRVYPATRGAAARALAVRHAWPLETARRWSAAAAGAVRAEAARGATVVLDHVYLDAYRPRDARYVLSLHNVEADVRRELPRPSGPRALEHAYDLAALARYERRAVRRPGAVVVTVSERDARRLGVEAHVVDNGADVPRDVPPLPRGGRVTYVGSMTWPPNVLAVEWWLADVAPHLAGGEVPPLTVVGRAGREVFGSRPGLDVLDVVPDVGEVLAASRAVAVPLRHGGGTRLKVLEALAYGRPVVSTSKGVEGLPVRHGEHVLVADDGAAFAAAVRDVCADDALAARLGAAGRALAESYDWRGLGDRFAAIVLGDAT